MQNPFNQIGVLFKNNKVKSLQNEVNGLKKQISSYLQTPYYRFSPIYPYPFDGEKTPGEMGAAKDYTLMYDYLRVRSWQSYLESEITQLIINKFILWIIGSGLKVQPEPVRLVLENEGIKLDNKFYRNIEARFNLWSGSLYSDACRMMPFNKLACEALKNAYIGGDCLVVLRYENSYCNAQVIDGSHVMTPFMDNIYIQQAKNKGNRIEYGVEVSQNNEHIAYYVMGYEGKVYRIPRYGKKSGILMAFMVYGNKYRINNVRGLPLIAAVLESLKKLDRYKEATVGSAEERQKIAYSIEHNADSTGENPLLAKLSQAKNLGTQEAPETKSTDAYEAAATKIATTTQKQAFNMPIGATMKLLESKNELYFKDFYTTNIQLVCASVKIPFEVAMSMYNSNYSASRAAIKDWEHVLKTSRENFAGQFYQNFYNFWLEMEILNGKIQADGYMRAIMEKNLMVIEAYRNAKWLGVNVPHIDPLKEVQAERMKLGDETTPLTTYDQATESLGTGDFSQITEKVNEEKKLFEPMKKNGEVNKQTTKKLTEQWQDN